VPTFKTEQPLVDQTPGLPFDPDPTCSVVVEGSEEGVVLTFPTEPGSRIEVQAVGKQIRVSVFRGRDEYPVFYGAVAPSK
jgi:hypothetical protein